jgi:hypothetical protein
MSVNADKFMDYLKSSELTKLKKLDLSGLKLQKLQNYTFYNMDNLEYVLLSDVYGINELNQFILNDIESNAFRFRNNNDQFLTVEILGSSLNEISFERGVFENAGRPLSLAIVSAKMTFLDQRVFTAFFESKYFPNQIFMGKNSGFDCFDCRNYWLIKRGHMSRVKTSDNRTCADPKKFDRCNE